MIKEVYFSLFLGGIILSIQTAFGMRIRELRARSGMSQEQLAYRAELDRSYISGVECGSRNVSLINIEKIAKALNISIEYLFTNEKLSTNSAYLQQDFKIPFLKRFSYQLDKEQRILSFKVEGLLTSKDVDYMTATLASISSSFKKGELSVFVDHREMKAADGIPAVYSPEVADRAVIFQQKVISCSKQVVVLCNSHFMVNQMDFVTQTSGIREKATHLYGKDRDMIGQAYQLLDIHGNELIKAAK
ncbi:helix-turn-helix domain-containing protein [Paenibacillus tengchongensis]|uniref:helix-turn-helix domain-containing protein n=1 Tax=Paenibacillus tengchongensis TaxID=2608684 RepID=UPI00124DA6FE|nr:helix-turn-helix transcriptional regulator [Paenibacillus tengchongensis]